jgi:hypothetical protein
LPVKGKKAKKAKLEFKRWRTEELAAFQAQLLHMGAGRAADVHREVRHGAGVCPWQAAAARRGSQGNKCRLQGSQCFLNLAHLKVLNPCVFTLHCSAP